ncbi:MAG TPA: S49 family peptidase [Candidatus Azoamicus sp.]
MQNDIFLDKNVIREILFDNLVERRRARRWKVFFKFTFFSVLLLLLLSTYFYLSHGRRYDHVAVIDISGLISDRSYTSAKSVIASLNEAFENENCRGVILRINSPGGTPVQSYIIYEYIKRLRAKHTGKHIYAVIEDIGTSGAYLIALGAEKIYCSKFSIVGSIGVIHASFGFSEVIKKIGIERRIYKAGKNKAVMDPFLEKNLDDEKILQRNLAVMHQLFINLVKENRYKTTLSINNEDEIFSGRFWVGQDSVSLGLVDGFSNVYDLATNYIGLSTLKDYNNNPSILKVFEKRI